MILLKDLVEVSKTVGATSRKKEKIVLLAQLLQQGRGKEISLAALYLSGRLPQGRIGIGWAALQQAMQAGGSRRDLTLSDVDQYFESLSKEKGSGSQNRKLKLLRELFSGADESERTFLAGLLMGELRQGALQGLVLESVGRASSIAGDRLRQSLMFSGDIGAVASAALTEGAAGLARFGPRLFNPVSPMLANPAEGEVEALERLGEAGWEYKLDGARIQVHKSGDAVRIFTRHLKDVTTSVPEIVEAAGRFRFQEAIFEGEAIALRPDGKPLPFQTTMRRFGRILEVQAKQREIPLTAYFFDLLYVDGQSLFAAPYRERFGALTERIPPDFVIPRIVTADAQAAEGFLRRSLAAGHEGVMAKGLDSPYMAGHRGYYWLKIKPSQTLDLVVLAAEWGHGRRKGYLSNLHLGARVPESGRFVMLGKTFKGLTDAMLRWQTEKFLSLEEGRDAWTVSVRPALVVEIEYGDLQESPRYPGGLALRFARVKRYREDKPALEADTIQKIWEIYEARWK